MLRENARWYVNKSIRCSVRNKVKHRKKYKIGTSPKPWVRFYSFSNSTRLVREWLKSYPRVSDISLSCTPPCVTYYISPHRGWSLIISFITQSRYSSSIDEADSNVYSRHRDLCWTLLNICATNDNWYAPFVANTSWSYPNSWFITGCVTRFTKRVPLVEQELISSSGAPAFSPNF